MLIVAAIGLVVNLISMKLLAKGSSESLNVKGAYFEVLSDMLGSVGVIVAALLMMWKSWALADPIIGAGIGLFIVPRTWILALLPQFPNSYIYRAQIWTHRREFDRARNDLCRRFGPNPMIALGRRDLAMAFSDWARYANRTKLLSQCERFLVSKEEGAAFSMR